MTQLPETDRVRSVTERTYTWYGWSISHTALRRIIGLIQLAFVILNGLIGPRFLLKLMAEIRLILLPSLYISSPLHFSGRFRASRSPMHKGLKKLGEYAKLKVVLPSLPPSGWAELLNKYCTLRLNLSF